VLRNNPMENEYLTVGEFRRWTSGVDSRLTTIDQNIGALNERTIDKKAARNHASGWSAGVAGVMIGAFEIIKLVLK
jgi:hypothetical protein